MLIQCSSVIHQDCKTEVLPLLGSILTFI